MKRPLLLCSIASIASITLTLLTTGTAFAEPGAEAQALFDDAKQLIQQGRWGDACPKLARSNQLDPRATTLFRLAECYETTGKPASAWTAYTASATTSAAAGETKRAEFARERAKKIEAALPYLVISASQRPLTVSKDGERIEEARFGSKIPVDPGDHIVVAEAPGKQRFTMNVFIVDPGTTVVTIPPLTDAPPEGPRAATPAADARGADRAQTPARPLETVHPNDNSGLRRWSIILSGGGLAIAGAGAALSLTSKDTANGCEGTCALGTGLMIGGALVAATGIAFFLASFGDGSSAARVSKVRPFEFTF